MYDTIYLTKAIPRENIDFENGWIPSLDQYGGIISYRKTIFIANSDYKHKKFIYLSYDNRIDRQSLLVSFSAPVLVHGTNVYEFDPIKDKRKLIKILNSNLHNVIDENIKEFNVSRLDICKNLIVNTPTKTLINSFTVNSLHKVSRKVKSVYANDGILLKSKRESLSIYDKVQAEKDKKHILPTEFENSEILRIENKITKKKGFKAKIRFGKTLVFKEIFYKKNIKKSKEILLKNFKDLFGYTDFESDIYSLCESIKRQYPNEDLFNLLHPILAYKNNLISRDCISRIVDSYYTSHKSDKLKKQLKFLEKAERITSNRFELLIYNQLKEALGI